MKKNTILFVSAYSNPELMSSEYLAIDIMKTCHEVGFDVLHVTPNPVRGLDKKTINKLKKNEIVDCVYGQHMKIKCFSFRERNFIFRLFRYFLFGHKVIKVIRKNKDRVAGIFLWSYPPIGFTKAITKFAKTKNIPIFFDVHDIQPDILIANRIVKNLIRKSVNFVAKNSTIIFTLSEDMKATLINKKIEPNKVIVIPPWQYEYDKDVSIPFEIKSAMKNNYVVSYIGNMGSFQAIETLLDVAYISEKNNDGIIFMFVGSGSISDLVRNKAQFCHNIFYYPKVDQQKSAKLYSLSDINIISLNENVIKYACPSKTPIVLSANKNVLLIMDDSYYSRELISYGATFCGDRNPKKIYETILKIKKEKQKHNLKIGIYDRELCLNKWKHFFETLYLDSKKN